jgi:hypothetical protein
MKFPEWNNQAVFGWINYRSLNYFVLSFLTLWMIIVIYLILEVYLLIQDFLTFSVVWQLITLYPLLRIIRKLKIESRKIERENVFGVWEQTTLGFYVLSNIGIVMFMCFAAGYVR